MARGSERPPIERLVAVLSEAETVAEAARILGVPRQTLSRWIGNTPELQAARDAQSNKFEITIARQEPGELADEEISKPGFERRIREIGYDPAELELDKISFGDRDGGTATAPKVTRSVTAAFKRRNSESNVGLKPALDGAPVVIKGIRPLVRPDRDGKLWLIISDAHIPLINETFWAHLLDLIRRIRPDYIVINGDWLNFSQLSRHSIQSIEELQQPSPQEEVDQGYIRGKQLRAAAGKDCEILMIEGNHDKWLERHGVQNNPTTTVLTQGCDESVEERGPRLHAIPHLLRMDEWGCQWVGNYPHGKIEVNERLRILHGHVVRKGAGSSPHGAMERADHATVSSHTHRLAIVNKRIITTRSSYIVQGGESGCLCDLDAIYMPDQDWQNGALTIVSHPGTDHYNLEAVKHNNGVTEWRDYTWGMDERMEEAA